MKPLTPNALLNRLLDGMGRLDDEIDGPAFVKAVADKQLTVNMMERAFTAQQTVMGMIADKDERDGAVNSLVATLVAKWLIERLLDGSVHPDQFDLALAAERKGVAPAVAAAQQRRDEIHAAEMAFMTALAASAPKQACLERDCPEHDWSDWACAVDPHAVAARSDKEKGGRIAEAVAWGRTFVRLSRSARRFCRKCGKAQMTVLIDPVAVTSAEAITFDVLDRMRPPWIPDDWRSHRDFRHGRHVEERNCKSRVGWWSDFGDLHTPGERIVEWSETIASTEIWACVSAVEDPALTDLWEDWRIRLIKAAEDFEKK